jgi:RNA polymerase sigma-70 factor (ECF subfamily)
MVTREQQLDRGLQMLRRALLDALTPPAAYALAGPRPAGTGPGARREARSARLLTEAAGAHRGSDPSGDPRGSSQAWSSEPDPQEASRLVALVDLARGGDAEAFGMLFDHYHVSVYRFVYYRVGSAAQAEDLTAETFYRALRSMSTFRWQGKDFGAWLMTIARNLTTDHFKSGRARLEQLTDDMSAHDESTEGPERSVLASLTNDALLSALTELPHEQRECLIMRFLQGLSIAETALVLGRSEGAVKQLQLRAVRGLAKLLPEGVR